MFRYALLIVLLLAASRQDGAHAQHTPKVDLSVDQVMVFNAGAIVTHKAVFDLKTGDNLIRLSGIPTSIDQNSLQVAGTADYEITGLRQDMNYSPGILHPLGRAKKDSLDDAKFSLKTKQALRGAYSEELLLLQANRNINGKNNILLAEDLEEMADFFRDRVKEINYLTLEINEEERELNVLIERLERELRDMKTLGNKNAREVIVRVNGKKNGRSELEVSYFAHEAGWEVFYDLRSAGSGSELELVSKARVRQFTGIDWKNVKLALSTGTPSFGGAPPTLYPWKIAARDPYVEQARSNVLMETTGKPSSKTLDDAFYDMEEVAAPMASETRQQLNTIYRINRNYDVSGDNRMHEVEVRRINIPATYRHLVVPKLNPEAFLTAEITDWDQYNLLAGEASVYFEGSFVGTSYLNPAVASDTLSLSLGRDRSINVDYEQVKDFSKTSSLGSKRRTTRGYKIKVMNTGTQSIKLRIEDQVPLSTMSDVEVEVQELSGGKLDPITGKVTWDVDVLPGRMSELLLKFEVKYPKKKVVTGL